MPPPPGAAGARRGQRGRRARAVRDDQRGAPLGQPAHGVEHVGLGLGRPGWPSARRGRGAARRGRRRGPGRDAGARPATGRRRRHRAGCRRRGAGAGRRMPTRLPRAPPPPAASLAPRRPTRTLSATERANRCGRWGTQPMPARQVSRSSSRRSTPPSRTWPEPGRRSPRIDLEEGGLAAAARADERHHLARLDHEFGAVQRRDAAARVGDVELGDADARVPRHGPSRPRRSVTGVSSNSKICSAAFIPSALAWKLAPRARRGR